MDTTRLTTQALGMDSGSFSVSFQSRLGRDPWLKPFTDQVLIDLAKSGVKRLGVVCPAFVADCLETLEEIGMTGSASFIAAGGQEFILIPCLNTAPFWMDAAAEIIRSTMD
jgi:ferrochelatase